MSKIISVKEIENSEQVCDVSIEDNHNLFVRGEGDFILAHNCFMERNGLRIDIDYVLSLSGTSSVFLKEQRKSERAFARLPDVLEANKRLLSSRNVRSGSLFGGSESKSTYLLDIKKKAHLIILFFDVLKLPPVKKGKDDIGSIDKGFIEAYAEHPVVKAFSDLRETQTLYANFIKGWYKILRTNPDNGDGRLRTYYKYLSIITGRSSCVAPWTLITTIEGEKRIDEIKVGDLVATHNGHWKPVTHLWNKGVLLTYGVCLSNGKTITCTWDHRFLNLDGEWISVGNIYERFSKLDITSLAQREASTAASRSDGAGTWFRNFAENIRGASHRQRYNKLRIEQSSTGDEDRPPSYPLYVSQGQQNVAIEKIEIAGSCPILDITVADDASYQSYGVFSHNSTQPNLQNVPERKSRAKIIKRQIISELHKLIVKRDFSSHEIRVWGISSRDPAIAQTFWTGMRVRLEFMMQNRITDEVKDKWTRKLKAADVHNQNYGLLYGTDPGATTKEQRNGVKSTIFGSLYGYGMKTLGRVITKHIPAKIKEMRVKVEELDKQIAELEGEYQDAA